MSLVTTQYLAEAKDDPFQFNTETGWQEVIKGLTLVMRGYFTLIAGTLAGLLFLWLAVGTDAPVEQLGLTRAGQESLLSWAVIALGLTAVASYGLLLAGQWHCLMYSPQREGAKELMYVCLNVCLTGSALNIAGVSLDGGRTYFALQQGLAEWESLDLWSPSNLLLMASALLGLFGSLVFSQFLRTMAGCFPGQTPVRSIDRHLIFLGLLLGGSIGTLFCVQQLARRAEFVPWLAGGWLLCFAWHIVLVARVRRCVRAGLAQVAEVRGTPASEEVGTAALTHTLSGLRRMIRPADG
jgi:hypothetical protein